MRRRESLPLIKEEPLELLVVITILVCLMELATKESVLHAKIAPIRVFMVQELKNLAAAVQKYPDVKLVITSIYLMFGHLKHV